MNFLFLLILTIAVGLATILVCCAEEFDWQIKLPITIFPVGLVAWLCLAAFTPKTIDVEAYLPVQELLVSPGGTIQVVCYYDENVPKVVNLQEKFKRRIDAGERVKLTTYRRYYYYGISFVDIRSICDETLVIEEKK